MNEREKHYGGQKNDKEGRIFANFRKKLSFLNAKDF